MKAKSEKMRVNVAIRSYISPELMMAFFENENLEPPANVKKAFEMRKEEGEEDA